VMVTVDCAVLGRRLNEARNGFKLPRNLELPCLPADLNWRDMVTDDDRLKYGP
jgi:(S)-2-hydroxy-acid oxidase